MRVAITGGTGFIGRHLARRLAGEGHEVVLIARGLDDRDPTIRSLQGAIYAPVGTSATNELSRVFAGCSAVAHCAGINREIGSQSYDSVHIEGTRNVVRAVKEAGVTKVVLLSFLRARPACRSGYHESKWAAEEIVRTSGLDYTVLKAGVIYGRGDHMLDHLSHAMHTFPVFALVGFRDKPVRPVAVEDVVCVIRAALIDGALSKQTVAVLGPEEMALSEAVRRVADVLRRRPAYVRCPVWVHYALGWVFERMMKAPLVSIAQARILSEGIVEPCGCPDELPEFLRPRLPFSVEQITKGLPPPGRFGLKDLLCSSRTAQDRYR